MLNSFPLAKLNRKVSIQAETPGSVDAFGQPLPSSWETVRTCWAEIDIQNSQLVNQTEAFISKVTHRITVRWSVSPVVTPNMRVLYTEPFTGVQHLYNIEAVLNANQQNFWLVLMAYEIDGKE